MLPRGKEEDSDRAIMGKSLGTVYRQTDLLQCWRWKTNLSKCYLFSKTDLEEKKS